MVDPEERYVSEACLRSRRLISRSMASLMKSRRTSSSDNSASMRSVVPSANGSVMRIGNSFLRPTRDWVAEKICIVKEPFRMYVIDVVSYIRYNFNHRYDWSGKMKIGQTVYDKRTNKQNTVLRVNKNGTLRVQFWGGRFGDRLLECTVSADTVTEEKQEETGH